MDFDRLITRRGKGSLKWDATGLVSGIDGEDVLPMWVADTDFQIAPVIRDALVEMAEYGVTGYFSDLHKVREAVTWWMGTRHDWHIDPSWVLAAHGLGNALAVIIDTLTEKGDGVVLFTPVYHSFAERVRVAERRVVEAPFAVTDGRMTFDLERAATLMDGSERLLILCSPQNPGGRVWSQAELQSVAGFARAHDLYVIADEIHHDLVFPGRTFLPFAKVTDITDRLVTITAPSKTFNTAGLRYGNMIVEDAEVRAALQKALQGQSIQPNMAGVRACEAAYSPEGAKWADAQVAYLDANRRAFDAGVNAIPGVQSMPLEATYLAWVDFSRTGMDDAEITARIENRARIVTNKGPTFGSGGEGYRRFNLGTQRARVDEAIARLQTAFSDLQ
ncbi:MAG: PatB family C-S lyase [Pseudomonadota bacterium]